MVELQVAVHVDVSITIMEVLLAVPIAVPIKHPVFIQIWGFQQDKHDCGQQERYIPLLFHKINGKIKVI